MDSKTSATLPLPTIRRYPVYLRAIAEMMAAGENYISSYVLAGRLGVDSVLARKDLAMAGVPGKPRRGYPARELFEAMNRAIGWDNATDAVLVGVGSLGRALLGYSGFKEQNLSVAVAFDIDPALAGTSVHGIKVRAVDEMQRLVRRMKLKLAILTVPGPDAQTCADELAAAGIKGILNFTPVRLSVPAGVIVQNVDLAQPLAVLSHSISKEEVQTGFRGPVDAPADVTSA